MDIWVKNISRKVGRGSKAAESPNGIAGQELIVSFGGRGNAKIPDVLRNIIYQLPGQSTPFFARCCTAISLQYQAGFRIVEIEGKSWTHELDIVKKRRSFQKLGSAKDVCLNALKDSSFKADEAVIMESAKVPAEAGGSA